ncbi:hypothetical protein AABB24_028386 [Solanum stoloniferum]|uniref:Uncharacterized protein n=1 Tax=Solanum stoloniferum TaxID=62892 RepID=A0ABD2S6C3_9SOLN
MEKVGRKELCPCQDKERYHELGSALEGCVHFNEDYKMLLLYIEQGRFAYGGYNPRPTCTDVEDGILSKKRGNEDRDLDNRKQRIDMEIVPGKEQKIKEGILSKKQRNEDRNLDSRKQRIDMEIVPGKEQKIKDGILSKKQQNEDRDLDNRKQRIDMEIVPGKEQKIKDGILSKKQRNEDRDLDNRKQRIDMEIVPGNEQTMKDGILSNRRGKDRGLDNRNHRIHVNTLPGKEQTMKDGILTKRRGNEDRGLDNRNHRIDVNIITGMEQRIQNDSKFMDAEVKIEPQEDSDSIKEAESESEVEILENVGTEVGWGSSSNPFVPSVERCLNLDATIIDSRYRKEVLNLLMTPYNAEEYKKLWKDMRMRLPSSSRNGRGKSLLSLHKGVNQEIKRAGPDKDKKLNIMRGFFFWLEHLTQQDAFQPWEDAECLQTLPGSP